MCTLISTQTGRFSFRKHNELRFFYVKTYVKFKYRESFFLIAVILTRYFQTILRAYLFTSSLRTPFNTLHYDLTLCARMAILCRRFFEYLVSQKQLLLISSFYFNIKIFSSCLERYKKSFERRELIIRHCASQNYIISMKLSKFLGFRVPTATLNLPRLVK